MFPYFLLMHLYNISLKNMYPLSVFIAIFSRFFFISPSSYSSSLKPREAFSSPSALKNFSSYFSLILKQLYFC